MKDAESHMCVQARYSIPQSKALGNEEIVKALRQLEKFETAVGGDSGQVFEPRKGANATNQAIESYQPKNDRKLNHQACQLFSTARNL